MVQSIYYDIFAFVLVVKFKRKVCVATCAISKVCKSKPYDVSIYSVPVEWDGMGCIGDMAETVLGSDEYFLLADNRIEAVDSRGYGPVKSSMFKGSAVLQFFPLNRIKLF